MEYGAIDLHKQNSLIRIVDATGTVVLDRTITTTREGFTRVFAGRAPLRVLVESGTESEWVAQTVEACGHAVIVADPNYALMYGARARAIKTDRRDVAALAEACRLGVYRRAHRVSAEQRARRREVRVRGQVVRMRTQLINLLRAQLRQEGYRLPSGSAETVARRYATLQVPAWLAAGVAPIIALLDALVPCCGGGCRGCGDGGAGSDGAAVDDGAGHRAGDGGDVSGGGGRRRPICRCQGAAAFVGLVPREDSSGPRARKGAITKAGPRALRALLVSAAWTVWRQRTHRGALHAWSSAWPPAGADESPSSRSPAG